MAEPVDRVITVCNRCGTEMPEGASYGDPCVNNDEGVYSQHEDGVELEIRRLHGVKAKREAAKMLEAGISSEEVLESLKGNGIAHDIALRAMLEVGFKRPSTAKEAVMSEEVGVSDSATGVKS